MYTRPCLTAAFVFVFVVLSISARADRATAATITLGQHRTLAETNAYAPLSQDQYYQEQRLINVTPAAADAVGDWTGTNVGGSVDTWHWVGHAHLETSTSATSTVLSISGAGSFVFDLTTFPGFIAPNNQATVFVPGCAADYTCSFTIDSPTNYSASALLGQFALFRLSSTQNGTIFSQSNGTSTAVPVSFSGTLPAGDYSFRANTSLAINAIGTTHQQGSLSNFNLAVGVPEPTGGATGAIIATMGIVRARRRVRPRSGRLKRRCRGVIASHRLKPTEPSDLRCELPCRKLV